MRSGFSGWGCLRRFVAGSHISARQDSNSNPARPHALRSKRLHCTTLSHGSQGRSPVYTARLYTQGHALAASIENKGGSPLWTTLELWAPNLSSEPKAKRFS